MKLTAPEYYKSFKCTADKCTHSCCIGWEIDVDADTMAKYAVLSGGYADVIRSSVEGDEAPHFRLGGGERCPHLDATGLCRIITEYGDAYLCDICREHPRFYNETARGLEVGLGMACEEACRIILGSDDYDKMTVIEEDGREAGDSCDFDVIPHRERIYSILKSKKLHFSDKITLLSQAYEIDITTMSDEECRTLLCSLEYLDESHRELFALYSSDSIEKAPDKGVLVRALAYFIYRHVTNAWDEDSMRARIGLCLFCVTLLASLMAHTDIDPVTAARIISEEIEYSEDNTDALTEVFI